MGFYKLPIREILDAATGVCVVFAAADGVVADEEVAAAAAQLVVLSNGALDVVEAAERFVAAAQALRSMDVPAYLEGLVEGLDPEARRLVVQVAAGVCAADGQVSADEKALYDQLVALAGVDFSDAENILADAEDERRRAKERASDAARVREALHARGWIDPYAALREAGVAVVGGGDAFQLQNAAGHLLRLEHYVEHGAFEFHVADASDEGPDYAFEYGDALDETLAAIFAVQNDVTVATADAAVRRVAAVCPDVYFTSNGDMERVTP